MPYANIALELTLPYTLLVAVNVASEKSSWRVRLLPLINASDINIEQQLAVASYSHHMFKFTLHNGLSLSVNSSCHFRYSTDD